jgi:hypothetical protein
MHSTSRRPYIGLSGGGVPAGGTLHAGHAYWQSTITPFSAAPQRYPALPEPSLYVTPTPRDLPDIVTRPYKLLRTVGKQGQILDEGFTRVAVVGTDNMADIINNLNQDVFMRPATILSEPPQSSKTSERQESISSGQTSFSQIGRGMDIVGREPGLVASGVLGQLDLNNDPMEEDAAGSMRSRQSRQKDVEMRLPTPPPPATAPTAPQRPTRQAARSPILNSSDQVFNIDPNSVKDNLMDALNMALKDRRTASPVSDTKMASSGSSSL